VVAGTRLWDALVLPVIDYGAEVWKAVASRAEKMEVLRRKGAKAMLGCARSAANDFVLSEIGWWPLSALRDQLRLRFLWRLEKMDDSRVVRRVFVARKAAWARSEAAVARVRAADVGGGVQRPQTGGRAAEPWCYEMIRVLHRYGLADVWRMAGDAAAGGLRGVPSSQWRKRVAAAVSRVEWQERSVRMRDKSSLEAFVRVKKSGDRSEYLQLAESGSLWRAAVATMAQLRSGVNDLDVSVLARRSRKGGDPLPRELRVCSVCTSGEVGDVEHFLLRCDAVSVERRRFWHIMSGCLDAIVPGSANRLFAVRQAPSSRIVSFMLGDVCLLGEERLYQCALRACVYGVNAMWRARAHVLTSQISQLAD
jgi:hypothetical protein